MGLVGGGRFETCAYGSRCKRGCRLLRSVCPSAGSWPWLFCAPPLSFGHFLREPGGTLQPLRPGHTPAFASLRVPFRCAKGDICIMLVILAKPGRLRYAKGVVFMGVNWV